MSDKPALKVVALPQSSIQNIPESLRILADRIEAGEYGDAHNLAWVIDEGAGVVSLGLMGGSAEPGAEAHLLFAMAQRKIEEL